MSPKETDMPALRELEAAVLAVYQAHPEMNDYTAGRAYEAAHRHYRARLRGRDVKQAGLDGVDGETYTAVHEVCERLLLSGPKPLPGMAPDNAGPVTVEKLTEYLRELARSVERNTMIGGRCGYLTLLRQFIPA